ncbi:uncharacterized protein EI97DRAFT_103562 [Westerdykella ornata]|uniref:Uncharacterized protein n=1 Tax=Westerdykella ornata TaxID=318751 RepID=A0A6A6JEE6_WESOR|nr:uncharacterized protein EI97DRAFT_103562 [Westerdykella ornata]KAF2274594.1 hypothetical protein EI97DRAFT_103562 [Westerdykella ornata]
MLQRRSPCWGFTVRATLHLHARCSSESVDACSVGGGRARAALLLTVCSLVVLRSSNRERGAKEVGNQGPAAGQALCEAGKAKRVNLNHGRSAAPPRGSRTLSGSKDEG